MTYKEFTEKGGTIHLSFNEFNVYKLGKYNGYFYEEEPIDRDNDPTLLRADVTTPECNEIYFEGGSDPLEDAMEFIKAGCPMDKVEEFGGYTL